MPLVTSCLPDHPIEGAGALCSLEGNPSFMEELEILENIYFSGHCYIFYTLEV